MTKSIDYQKPPVVEVAVAVSFKRIPGFKVPHVGAFWKRLPDEFTEIEDHAAPFSPGEHVDLNRLRLRTWFLTADGKRLIQLGDRSFVFNWRRLEDDPADYPEFDTIFPEFLRGLESFSDFLRAENLGELELERLELAYVNIVQDEETSEVIEDPNDLLVDHRSDRSARFLPRPSGFQWRTFYDLPEGEGDLIVDAQRAKPSAPDAKREIRLEIAARKVSDLIEIDEMKAWFGVAHHHIVNAFEDVTDDTVQNAVWGKR